MKEKSPVLTSLLIAASAIVTPLTAQSATPTMTYNTYATLGWDPSVGATGYIIYWRRNGKDTTNGQCPSTPEQYTNSVSGIGATTNRLTVLPPGTNYICLRVAATNGSEIALYNKALPLSNQMTIVTPNLTVVPKTAYGQTYIEVAVTSSPGATRSAVNGLSTKNILCTWFSSGDTAPLNQANNCMEITQPNTVTNVAHTFDLWDTQKTAHITLCTAFPTVANVQDQHGVCVSATATIQAQATALSKSTGRETSDTGNAATLPSPLKLRPLTAANRRYSPYQ